MSDRAPYSRVYWSVMDDPKFQGIYEDDAAFACWVRLLMTADALWPQAPGLPRATRKRSLDMLVTRGIVDLMPGHRYRIRGLDSERERRKWAATRDPSGTQAGPKRDPDGFGTQGLSQAKPSRAEKSRAEHTARADDPADAYWELTGKYPVDKSLSWVDDLTAKFGADAVIRALVKAHTEDRNAATLLGRTQDHLRHEARELDRREREDEQRRLREKRAVPRSDEPWQVAYREALKERYGEDAA